MVEFDIIKYLSGLLGGFVFDRATLEAIALDRGVSDVVAYEELSYEQREILRADLAYAAYCSPSTMASNSQKHGNYSNSVGQQVISEADRERLYNIFAPIYKKYEDEKLEVLESDGASLQWL